MKCYEALSPTGFAILKALILLCDPEEGRFHCYEPDIHRRCAGKTVMFRTFSHMPWKSRIQASRGKMLLRMVPYAPYPGSTAFINVPMADARDFHCHSHVTDNLGERCTSSDHVAIRVVIRKQLDHCGTGKRILSCVQTSRLLHHFEATQ